MIKKDIYPDSHNMFINDVPVTQYGAIVETYKVSGTGIENSIYQGLGRTSFAELSYRLGQKVISVNLFFSASTQRALAERKSALDGLMVGKTELHLPDGFFYTAVCTSFGELQMLGVERSQMIALCTYMFSGIQHDALQTVTGNTVLVKGSMPRIDCRISCETTAPRASLTLGTVTFFSVPAGAMVVADGMTGELSVNGQQVLPSFSRLPYVSPGLQTFSCPETLTVSYYPTWI